MTSKSPPHQTSIGCDRPNRGQRRNLPLWVAAFGFCCFALISRGFAHPEIEAQLAHVTGEIASSPDSAELYIKRGQLHRVHRDWQQALADFNQAAELDPKLHRVERDVGQVHLESGQTKQALAHFERFLALQPGDPEGLLLRGRALAKLGETERAAADFDSALPKLRRPTPALFIERAQILLDGGEQFRSRALAGIAEGIGKVGDLYTLHRFAAKLELEGGQPEAALRRVRKLIDSSKGQLSWRIAEAEILVSLGRTEAARTAYTAALEAIATLPPHRRRTASVSEIEKSARAALEDLDTGS